MINDAMLAGALDIAGTGAPGFITLWAKTRGGASAVTGVCGLGNGALWLNTNNANIKSLRDFSEKDKIAAPGIKSSFAAVVLQMAAAQGFGIDNYAKLDPLTVGMPHPEAMAALVSGKTEIDAHFASPPFSNQELTYPNIHRVITTLDLLGPITIDVVFASKRFADANPALMKAFLAAKDEADKLIAAESYARMSRVNLKPELIRAMLDDKETSFTVAPAGVMKYADFLGRIGTIKDPPRAWTELFIPELQSYSGS
jgi:NitT/TauT family transport system substrate-binding protein